MGLSVDIGVIGGGIHGAGVAQAAAAAGYSVCVWEQAAIASGTSSRSSKLIHGGLRYLESGQFSLVRKSLAERSLLLRNAPGLVKLVPFYIPVYQASQRPAWKIWLGLSLYSFLGRLHRNTRFQKVRNLYRAEKDGLQSDELQCLYQYWDAQTDDVALTGAVMQSAQSLGAELYCSAKVTEVRFRDHAYHVQVEQSGQSRSFTCHALVNAAGPWVNQVLATVIPATTRLEVDLVQGTHIIVEDAAPSGIYYVEAPQDQRAVFIMPWKGMTMIGTTETAFPGAEPEDVRPTGNEVEYLLQVYRHYFPARAAKLIESFAGLRVLPKQDESFFQRSREMLLHQDPSMPGLLTLYGGKLTGYRGAAEEVMHRLRPLLGEKTRRADTHNLKIG